jgi:hypothetical protein
MTELAHAADWFSTLTMALVQGLAVVTNEPICMSIPMIWFEGIVTDGLEDAQVGAALDRVADQGANQLSVPILDV